jgi:hypothetical protein
VNGLERFGDLLPGVVAALTLSHTRNGAPMAKFRKKPVIVEARRWDGTAEAAGPLIDWILTGDHCARYHDANDGVPGARTEIAIDTLEGTITASPGDWIIRGAQGEFYPIKDSIFRETYEPVDGAA